jgi:hypothetical protein
MGNYNPLVDDLLTFNCTVLIVDDTISNSTAQFPINYKTVLNNGAYSINATNKVNIVRTGSEIPVIGVNATFLTSTTSPFTST